MQKSGSEAGVTGRDDGRVSVAVANLYAESSFRSEICSQAVLWEAVTIDSIENGFARVTCEDGYQGWLDEQQIVFELHHDPRNLYMCTANHAPIFEPESGSEVMIAFVTAGGYVEVEDRGDEACVISFPDGRRGRIDSRITPVPFDPRPGELVPAACRLLGVPYWWGGKTPAGLDCSGLMQLIHKLCGISIPRDSADQHGYAKHLSNDPLDAKQGDMLFFSGDGSRITHVGMSLANGDVIHSRGIVRIDSMIPESDRYRQALIDTFVDVRTCVSGT